MFRITTPPGKGCSVIVSFINCDGKIVLLTVFTGLFTTLLNPSREPGAEHYFSDNFS